MKKEIQHLKQQINQTHSENKTVLIDSISTGKCEIIDATAYPTVKELQATIDQRLADGYKLVTSLNSLLIFTK